jgi:4,4'-diaponeurosporenoate glycosyltransferase
MAWVAAICCLGLPAGFLLLWHVPLCREKGSAEHEAVSVIIPARNEERSLPNLLKSIRQSVHQPAEVIVVDDASKDGTAEVGEAYGCLVLPSRPLPAGWTGKTWACHQGVDRAAADVLLFLDADTFFSRDGFKRIAASYSEKGSDFAGISVLPFHVMEKPYEELSLFFNLLMAMGAGGFGCLGKSRLFGQSLIISRDLYSTSGGHKGVSSCILENFALASRVEAAGGHCVSFGGRGALNIRMFPDGMTQLCEGWTKAFADGAAGSDPAVLGVAVFWLATLCASFLLFALSPGFWRDTFGCLYLAFALQLFWFARQIGNYRVFSCMVYPLPLLFYFGIFGLSLYRKVLRKRVSWRGRTL